MMKILKGLSAWTTINGLFMWAVVSACILGSAVGYNFMAWVTGLMCVISVLMYLGVTLAKVNDAAAYEKLQKQYDDAWHVNKYVDILYDVIVLVFMVYGGFLGIASVYTVTMFAQFAFRTTLVGSERTSQDIISEYDDSVLDRIGIDQNERGR